MKNQRKIQALLSYYFENVFFSESLGIRFLRTFVLISFMLTLSVVCAYIFESPTSLLDLFKKTPPYLLAPFSAVIAAILLGARYLQDIYELPGYSTALHYMFASLLDGPPYWPPFSGWLLPSLTISKGQKVQDDEVSLPDQVGGPGWLTVEPGNVVLLEHLQSPTMILGAGVHFIPRFMRVQEITSLEDQHWKANPVVATTKDGIEVVVHDFQFTYRLCSNRHENLAGRRTMLDPYPFSLKAVRDLAYKRNVRADNTLMPWGGSMQFRVDGAITDFINKNTIDQVLAPTAEDTRNQIMQRLYSSSLRTLLKNVLGTELIWANVGRFDLNDEVIRESMKKYRMDSWFAQWAGKAALILAQGRAEQISQEEGGRSESTATMLKSIIQSLDDAHPTGEANEHLWNIVLARTAQVIESMTSVYDLDMSGLSDQVDGEIHESK
ncbi:MAG: hypothetical protein EHM40_11970 [Chloroflexi bacterium]|nr:MAG: hypothetical protein EHM40_11970 [Chloroflexota bacterium]